MSVISKTGQFAVFGVLAGVGVFTMVGIWVAVGVFTTVELAVGVVVCVGVGVDGCGVDGCGVAGCGVDVAMGDGVTVWTVNDCVIKVQTTESPAFTVSVTLSAL